MMVTNTFLSCLVNDTSARKYAQQYYYLQILEIMYQSILPDDNGETPFLPERLAEL